MITVGLAASHWPCITDLVVCQSIPWSQMPMGDEYPASGPVIVPRHLYLYLTYMISNGMAIIWLLGGTGMPEEFLAKVAAARYADEQQHLQRLSQLRNEDRARLEKQRLHREKVCHTKSHSF